MLAAALLLSILKADVVVTAERAETPRAEVTTAITVLDRETIDAIPATNASELLGLALNVYSASGSVPATVSVRGFYGGGEVDATRLLVDGIPVSDAESGLVPWQQLRASEIERIEVVRGLASTLYGDAAIGGVVQLFTRHRSAGDWSATLTGGSHDTRELDAAAWTRLLEGELAIFGSYRETGGDRAHSSADRKGLRAMWRAAVDQRLLSVGASWDQSSRNDPGPLAFGSRDNDPLFAGDRDRNTRRQLSASIDATRWIASMYATSRGGEATRTILLLPPVFGDTASRDIATSEIGTALQLVRDSWRAGFDASSQKADIEWDSTSDKTNASRTALAAYITKEFRLSRMIVSGGLRAEKIGNDSALSPRLGIAYNAGGTSLYAGAGAGFKAPSLEQLYDVRPLRLFGDSFTLANRELVPQRARGIEAGIAHRSAFGRIALDAYTMRVRDEIDFDPRTFRYGNIARSEHHGFEFHLEPSRAWLPRITYALAQVHGESGTQLKNVPEHTATALLPLHLPRGIDVALMHTWTANRFYDDGEQVAAPDTNTTSIRMQYSLVRIDLLNVFDENNQALGYALPDMFGGLSTYAYPDQRRTIRVSLTFRP